MKTFGGTWKVKLIDRLNDVAVSFLIADETKEHAEERAYHMVSLPLSVDDSRMGTWYRFETLSVTYKGRWSPKKNEKMVTRED